MIPLRGRLFPERSDIEIAGMMDPASDVGGDFFDAFFADERHLFFCVGDVSGHGIPAALFMARTIGLIRIAAMGTRHPEQLLERIDEQLGVSDLAATAAAHETPKLLLSGPSSPLRLLLERPEAPKVAVRFNHLFH